MKRTLWLTAGLAAVLPTSLAWSQDRAQQPSDRQQTTEQEQTGQLRTERRQQTERAETRRTLREDAQPAAAGDLVPSLAMLLALGNKAEIELGQLASEKTQNPEVRQFAQKMIEDHTQFLTKLKKFNPQIPDPAQFRSAQTTGREGQPGTTQTPGRVAQAGGTDQPQRRNGEVEQTGFDRSAAGSAGQQPSALVAIHKDAAQQKLQMTKEELSKLDGQDFDMGYLSNQVHAHVGMLAHLKAMHGKGDSEFNQLIEQGVSTTTEHLKMAKDMAKKLESREYEAGENPQRNQRTQPNQRNR